MNSKHVLLISPATSVKVFGSNDGGGSHPEPAIAPPLGILYLAAELRSAGYTVEAYDFNAEEYSIEKLARYLKGVDLVGISMMSFNREQAGRVIADIRLLKPGLPVIVGGPDCILHPRAIPGALLTVCQEAENIIVEIVDTVLKDGDLSVLPGILYTDSSGREVAGRPYKTQENLDSIKFPTRSILRDNKGYSIIGPERSRKITTIITSRGCPKRCRFCAHGAIAYQRFRKRSAKNVLDEIELIVRDGYEILGIVDDNFTADRARALEILKGIQSMNAHLSIAVQGRSDCADLELFIAMKKAGVKAITFGLESGNQDVLDFYNKGTTVEQNSRALRLADKAGLYTAGLFIIGTPFETMNHFQRTYSFAASMPLDITSFWVLDYTYGSLLWQEAHSQGKINSHEFNVPAGKERGTSLYPTRELEEIAQKMFFKFYRQPAYWIRQIWKFMQVRDVYFLRVLMAGIKWLVVRKMELMVGRGKGFLLAMTKRRLHPVPLN